MTDMKDLHIDDFFYENFSPRSEEFQSIPFTDLETLASLWSVLAKNKPFTRNQANLLCKLLQKYKKSFCHFSIDLDRLIENQQWKKPFREIDATRKIYVEEDHSGIILLCLKFPYQLKTKFDDLFLSSNEKNFSFWDDHEKVRKVELYKINFLQILEFSKEHRLEIDSTVLDLADEIDEIWQNKDSIEKRFNVKDDRIKLINASESARDYFEKKQSNLLEDNLLLAKELGHISDSKFKSQVLEKICSADNNLFWTNQLEKFIEIHCQTSIKTCVILDKTSDYKDWLTHFIDLCDRFNIPRSEIKICFREDSKNSDFNQWIKNYGLGGKTDSGRIYIFLSSPAKWVYKDIESFKIILLNGLFPHTNKNVQSLINHHPLVIYTGNNRPSPPRDFKIEEL